MRSKQCDRTERTGIPAFLLTGWMRWRERACDERDGWEAVA